MCLYLLSLTCKQKSKSILTESESRNKQSLYPFEIRQASKKIEKKNDSQFLNFFINFFFINRYITKWAKADLENVVDEEVEEEVSVEVMNDELTQTKRLIFL